MLKEATTKNPIIDVIKKRWSNRAFSDHSISIAEIETLFEAASWAPSSGNEQPWVYYFVQKSNPEKFEAMLNCLDVGNKIWAKNCDIIIVGAVRKTFAKNGATNTYAAYDLGASNYGLLLQAQTMGIYGHIMAGFYPEKVAETLNLDDNIQALTILALGYVGEAESLEEPFKTRELTPRSRKGLEEFVHPI
jgi:nitroreductase